MRLYLSLLAAFALAMVTIPIEAESGPVRGVAKGTATVGKGVVKGTAQAGKGVARGTGTAVRATGRGLRCIVTLGFRC